MVSSLPFLLAATSFSLIIKACILITLIIRGLNSSTARRTWFLLLCVLVGSMISDSAWILELSQRLILPSIDYRFLLFCKRIAWGFTIVQYKFFSKDIQY